MEEISTTSLQPISNESPKDVSAKNEMIMDKPSDFQHISPVEQQPEIVVPRQGRKPKRKVLESQEQVCDQEKDTAPLRPLRRKDSLTPDCKQKSDGMLVKLPPEVTSVQSVAKDITCEIIPLLPAIKLSCSLKQGDSSVPLGVPQNEHAQESVDAQEASHTYNDKKIREAECVQIPMDVVPPPRVKKRDSSLPPENRQRTAPSKPLRKKDCVTRETPLPKTNDQENLKATVSSAPKESDSVTPKPCDGSSDVSGTPEQLQGIDEPCQVASETVPSQPVRRKEETAAIFVWPASLQIGRAHV